MEFKDVNYLKTHEWVSFDGNIATIGVSDYAQHEMGDVVFVELPEVGDKVTAGKDFTTIESVKAVFDIMSPVSGTITEVNEDLESSPELINKNAFDAWLVKVEFTEKSADLLSVDEYKPLCK
ncbi:MAG: glycine cleavage system protein GcvH [Treponemataceae bacterium]